MKRRGSGKRGDWWGVEKAVEKFAIWKNRGKLRWGIWAVEKFGKGNWRGGGKMVKKLEKSACIFCAKPLE